MKFIIVTIFLFFNQLVYSKENLKAYYHNTNKAENYILNNRLDSAQIYFCNAFSCVAKPFASFLQENQQLQANQVVCSVNPDNAQFCAEVFIPQSNFGKIRQGQTVLLKFPSYPFQEYGSVKGKLDFISNISTDSGYLAKVVFNDGLVTSYKKTVQFREGLTAQAEIITHDMRLLQRLYYNTRKQVQN